MAGGGRRVAVAAWSPGRPDGDGCTGCARIAGPTDVSPSPAPAQTFPEYRVRARNLSRYSANKIHDDVVARRYGYAGGLVAGTTLHAYLTRPLVAAWGTAWLARGTAGLTLHRPVYDGDEIQVTARVVGRSGSEAIGEIAAEATVAREGEVAATLLGGLGWGGPPLVPSPAGYPVAPLPATRVPASPEALAALGILGSPTLVLEASEMTAYSDEVDEELAVYRGPAAIAHPGLLLQQANRALAENVALGPWVHARSDLAHCGLARAGDVITTRGRPRRLLERKGHAFVELDLLVVANGSRPVLWVRHTAIYRLRGGEDGQRG
jgi:acyl dehydratase